MEILLRKYDGQYYVWKKAELRNGSYYITEKSEEVRMPHSMIIAVKTAPNISYVMCRNCGRIIKNDKESIEAHYAEQEAKRDCTKCSNVRYANKKRTNILFEKNADGRYLVTESAICDVVCRIRYNDNPIDSQEAKEQCQYNMCRKLGVKPVEDIFFTKPGLFDKFITVDALISKKYDKARHYDNHFEYDLKSRGTLQACVNELGIVDHFRLYYRYNEYNIFYSAKYDEMFFITGNGEYTTSKPYSVTWTKIEEIKKKIAALYEEANK